MLCLPSSRVVSVVGGGKSLEVTQKGITGFSIGCNRTAFELDTDMLHSMDMKFMKEYKDQIDGFNGYIALSTRPEPAHDKIEKAYYFRQCRKTGLSDVLTETRGHNTGYSALNVAYLMGAEEIHLFGIDMRGGHFHGGYRWNRVGKSEESYKTWANAFEVAKKQLDAGGIRVYHHVSKEIDSQLDCFDRIEY